MVDVTTPALETTYLVTKRLVIHRNIKINFDTSFVLSRQGDIPKPVRLADITVMAISYQVQFD